ncbi:hypothetical protein F5883DRAFT_516590 [Diaporthe sp. PMI_573]|nr:hypothetical protein F5883DRAFT_516590 [Diaporthaceae sp. PMI_573]
MDSHVYQGKSAEMTSKASSTLGSEENQQTNCQLTAYARDAIWHLEYKNPKDVGLTTRRQSQPSTAKARRVRKFPKRFRCGERLADGRICGKAYTNRYGISKHIKVVNQTGSSPAKPSVESEAVDVQIPEWWCPLDPPIKAESKEPEVLDNRPPRKTIQVIVEAILSAPDEHLSLQEIKSYVAKRYPWYMQPIRKSRFQELIKKSLNPGKLKPFEQVPEMQDRWRVTASYRRELRELESLPVFSTE